MNHKLKTAFNHEMQLAQELYRKRDYVSCFRHLERAHVLGQRHVIPHTINHWWMLKVGFRTRDPKEIFGQVIRVLGGGIGSLVGRVPIGNTGGANVGVFTPMPIAPDIAEIFRGAGIEP